MIFKGFKIQWIGWFGYWSMMDSGSEGESNKNSGQVEGFKKPKRQMKTPFQLETLERTYAGMFDFFLCICVYMIWVWFCVLGIFCFVILCSGYFLVCDFEYMCLICDFVMFWCVFDVCVDVVLVFDGLSSWDVPVWGGKGWTFREIGIIR